MCGGTPIDAQAVECFRKLDRREYKKYARFFEDLDQVLDRV